MEWGPSLTEESAIRPITEYQINLKSPSDDTKQIANFSSQEHSYTFFGLKVNAVYEISLRAKNSEGFSLPAKEQLSTTAGTTTEVN